MLRTHTGHLLQSALCYIVYSHQFYFIHSINGVYVSTPVCQFTAPILPRYPHTRSLHLCYPISALQIRLSMHFSRFHIYTLILEYILRETILQKHTCTSMFIAALFITVKTWKQLKCPSAEEWIKMRYTLLSPKMKELVICTDTGEPRHCLYKVK